MSLITNIDGVPLYTTIEEAELWGSQYNLTGYHTHTILGQVGYMGGIDHATIINAMQQGVQNTLTPQQIQNVQTRTTRTFTRTYTSGGGGGY